MPTPDAGYCAGMSKENVEIVRAAFEAVNRGDLDAAVRYADPDCKFDQSRAIGPDQGIYNVEQFLAVTRDFRGTWDSVQWEVAEYIDAREHVVTPATNHLRGRNGVEVQARVTWLWTFRDGAVQRVTLYQEREEALKAAGLAE